MRTLAISFGMALVWAQIPVAVAQTESAETPKPSGPTRAELQDKQLDATLEARDIERILTKLKRASDLSKERISAAAKVAEEAASAIDRGDSKVAQTGTKQAAEMFREIAKQLEALLAEETPQRIAAASKLANQLAKTERQFAQQFQGALNPTSSGGKGKIDPKSVVKPGKNQTGQGEGGQQEKMEQQKGEGKGRKSDADKSDDPKGGGGPQKKEQPSDKGEENPADGDARKGEGKGQKPDDKSDDPKGGGGPQKKEQPSDKAEENPSGSGGKQKTEKSKQDGGGEMTEEERREALAQRAEQLAQTGQTLEDILKSITQSTEPGDKEAVRKVEEILKETNLAKAVESMQQAADMIRAGKLDDARLASLDIADRMEITGQRLDAAYRTIVAPQAEDLIELERRLAGLREEMEDLQTPSQVRAWHREMDQLLQKLEELGVSEEARELLIEELKKAGWGSDDITKVLRGLVVNGGRYDLPAQYTNLLRRIQDELQARIQTLILGDITSATDEVAPPKYQDLVERYLQVLSRESGKPRIEIKSPKPVLKP